MSFLGGNLDFPIWYRTMSDHIKPKISFKLPFTISTLPESWKNQVYNNKRYAVRKKKINLIYCWPEFLRPFGKNGAVWRTRRRHLIREIARKRGNIYIYIYTVYVFTSCAVSFRSRNRTEKKFILQLYRIYKDLLLNCNSFWIEYLHTKDPCKISYHLLQNFTKQCRISSNKKSLSIFPSY